MTNWNDTAQKFTGSKAFEHNFSAGYQGSIIEDLGYTVAATYYYYAPSDVKSNTWETLIGLNYKNFAFDTQTLFADVTWGNKGDTYLVARYHHALPKDFNLNALLGAYYDHDQSNFESELNTQQTFAFRHVTLSLSRPFANTGVTASIDYIIGGKLRDDTSLKNKVVFGIKYQF